MTIIAAISNSAAETRCDYSNPKPIAGVAKLYTDTSVAAAAIIARRNLIHDPRADRDVKIKDIG